jgi:hypothetical protein
MTMAASRQPASLPQQSGEWGMNGRAWLSYDTLTRLQQSTTAAGLHCITQDPREPAGPEFLAVCDDNAAEVGCSRFCPPECGGHLVCGPCWTLAQQTGLAMRCDG